MFDTLQKIHGHLEAYKITSGGERLRMYGKKNTINVDLYTALRNSLLTRANEIAVDAIAWGSWKDPSAGSFVDSDYAGTTGAGTQGALIQSQVGSIAAKFSGTFSFSSTKQINFFELGDGYVPAAGGVTELFTNRYCYDNSLLTGSTYLTYENGESLIVDWTITVGS